MKNQINLDSRNARVHDDRNRDAIRKSLQELGAGRAIVMDKENVIIAGNGVYEQAKELKLPVKVIESDGRELVVIKRTDLGTDDDKRKALAIADNKTSDLSVFDENKLSELFSEMDSFTTDCGFTEGEIEKLLNMSKTSSSDPEEKPEIEFTEELLEQHNYIVLYFDNEVDWLQAKTLFNLKTVKALKSKPGYEQKGLGRVLNGAKALNDILMGAQ